MVCITLWYHSSSLQQQQLPLYSSRISFYIWLVKSRQKNFYPLDCKFRKLRASLDYQNQTINTIVERLGLFIHGDITDRKKRSFVRVTNYSGPVYLNVCRINTLSNPNLWMQLFCPFQKFTNWYKILIWVKCVSQLMVIYSQWRLTQLYTFFLNFYISLHPHNDLSHWCNIQRVA